MRLLYEIRQQNLKELKAYHTYTEFVYAIACNVPNSTAEEGTINKNINWTATRHS